LHPLQPEVKGRPEQDNTGRALTDEERQAYFATIWRTFQMSDHLPLWVELQIDFSDAYLGALSTDLPDES